MDYCGKLSRPFLQSLGITGGGIGRIFPGSTQLKLFGVRLLNMMSFEYFPPLQAYACCTVIGLVDESDRLNGFRHHHFTDISHWSYNGRMKLHAMSCSMSTAGGASNGPILVECDRFVTKRKTTRRPANNLLKPCLAVDRGVEKGSL